jgi:hypothetical protein
VGADILTHTSESKRYLAVMKDVLGALAARVGRQHASGLLWCHHQDGSFPNVFAIDGELEVTDFKVMPRAAVRAFERVLASLLVPDDANHVLAILRDSLGRHGLLGSYDMPG